MDFDKSFFCLEMIALCVLIDFLMLNQSCIPISVMMHYPFLIYIIELNLLKFENIYICIHEGYWFVILFPCNIFIVSCSIVSNSLQSHGL